MIAQNHIRTHTLTHSNTHNYKVKKVQVELAGHSLQDLRLCMCETISQIRIRILHYYITNSIQHNIFINHGIYTFTYTQYTCICIYIYIFQTIEIIIRIIRDVVLGIFNLYVRTYSLRYIGSFRGVETDKKWTVEFLTTTHRGKGRKHMLPRVWSFL